MKKAIIIIGIILAIIIGSMFAVPVIFKNALLEKVKSTINQSINAKVDFTEFKLSLFRNFPKATLEIQDVAVTGVGFFEGDTLLYVPSFRSSVSLKSLFSKDNMALEELVFVSPVLNLKADTLDANWNIMKETEAVQQKSPSSDKAEKPFVLKLDKIKVQNASINYTDNSMPMTLSLNESDLNLAGNLFGSETELKGDVSAGKFYLNYDSVTYISNTSLFVNALIDIDFSDWTILIKESECRVNNLPFDLSGDIKMPNDSIWFNLEFQAKKSKLEDFLALTPPDYEKYLESVEAEGTADMSGYFKGLYYEEEYPSFSFDFTIENGRINYTDLPEEIKDISTNVRVWKPQGSLDLLTLSVKNTHADVAGNPIDLSFEVGNIYSDMSFNTALNAKLDFDKLKNALPIEDMALTGTVDANISAKGNYSDIDKKQYDKISAGGRIIFSDLVYSGDKAPVQVKIPSGQMEFTPSEISLSGIQVLAGNNDISVSGKLSNYLRYFLYDGILGGEIKISSDNADLNELMAFQNKQEPGNETLVTDKTTENETEASSEPILIPDNYDLKVLMDVKKSKYEQLSLSNIHVDAGIKNGVASLNRLTFAVPGSEIQVNGKYGNSAGKVPLFNLTGNIKSLDIASIYNSVPTLGEVAPQAAKAKGKVDIDFKVEGEAGNEIKLNDLSGSAVLSGFSYTDPELSQPVQIPNGRLNFNSTEVILSGLQVIIGSSDLKLDGKFLNFMEYYNSNETLTGKLQLRSQYLNLNEIMNLQVKTEESKAVASNEGEESSLTAFDIPSNLDIEFTSQITDAAFGRFPLKNVNGLITAKNGKLSLDGLNINLFGGELTLNGSYSNNPEKNPDFDFGFAVNEIDLPVASRTILSLQKLLPANSKSQGKVSTKFSTKGKLGSDLSIIPSSVNGSGTFNTKNFQIVDSPTFEQLKNILKQEKLRNITVDNFTAQFSVTDGNILLKPFQTEIAGQQANISGKLNVDDIIDMKMDFVIERSAFGPDIQDLLKALPGQDKITAVPVTVLISGPVNKPDVKMDYSETQKYIADIVKESASDGLKKIGDALKKLIK
ncbi:MAG: hypothetical protein JXR31_13740 [Prolixibacteraceae bacterium]|nr:hypothetical protein [Prolixibacteraceae bacterium]MBN2775313.1 hypothetical protein [Prolixibacteraceae bacterium]